MDYLVKDSNPENFTLTQVTVMLDTLCRPEFPVLVKETSLDSIFYLINIGKILLLKQTHVIASVIQNKLGEEAARIFRILLAKDFTEIPQIATWAMLPDKHVSQLLYNMLPFQYISIQVKIKYLFFFFNL